MRKSFYTFYSTCILIRLSVYKDTIDIDIRVSISKCRLRKRKIKIIMSLYDTF